MHSITVVCSFLKYMRFASSLGGNVFVTTWPAQTSSERSLKESAMASFELGMAYADSHVLTRLEHVVGTYPFDGQDGKSQI